jgi:hypothetical protein
MIRALTIETLGFLLATLDLSVATSLTAGPGPGDLPLPARSRRLAL